MLLLLLGWLVFARVVIVVVFVRELEAAQVWPVVLVFVLVLVLAARACMCESPWAWRR